MTQSNLGDHTRDDDRAWKLVRAIQTFVDEFVTRKEGGQLRKLLDGKELTGGIMRQTPEDFTEHELIEPCLDALGFANPKQQQVTVDDPQFGRQPSHYPKVERNRPDYELRNVHQQLTCILEVKAINREPWDSHGKATENIATYLADNTFCKYAKNHPPGVLVGIGTDGFRWTLWLKDLHTGEVYDDVVRTSILNPVRNIATNRLQAQTDAEAARAKRLEAKELLKSYLVQFFSLENIVVTVDQTIDRIDMCLRKPSV